MTAVPLAPVQPPPVPVSARSFGRWNSLRRLKAARGLLLVLEALLLIAVLAGVQRHMEAMTNVGKDTAPSIIAAQHIKSALADMDANAANELLAAPGQAPATVQAYEARRVEASTALIHAAENITFGDSERKPILDLQLGLGTYERLVQRARDLHESAGAAAAPAAVAAYRGAAALMDGTLLPRADALDKANTDALESKYERQSSLSSGARGMVLLAGLLVTLALVATQVLLTRLTRRTLNPLLLLATVLAVGFTLYCVLGMQREQRQLKLAKEDAFASLHALWSARAISYAANSDESRYLLDPGHAAAQEQAFFTKTGSLATLPAGLTPQRLVTQLRAGKHVEGFSGYLADELNNITFVGEQEAATRTVAAWEAYLAIDAQMRHLQQTGMPGQALVLCLGTGPGQSNYAFDQFDKALGATLDINQQAFDAAVADGFAALNGLAIKAAVAVVLIGVLTFLGLAPRIREYE